MGAGHADYKLHWDFGGREDRDGWQRFTLYRVRGDRYVRAVFFEGASGKYLREYESFHVWVPRRCLQPNKRIGVRGRTWNWIRYRDTGMPSRGYYDDVPNHGFARG